MVVIAHAPGTAPWNLPIFSNRCLGWGGDVNVPVKRMMSRCSYWLGWGGVGMLTLLLRG